ncbi:MAG: hypothetical protein K9H25_00365 [Rhodospirillum sp.]|nr:hypothetical protein [Rhodospirillum sp.]MCF8488201.1 hypothetical protein [Rhodospirillum sp.]MCF8501370.1 hypothetical protein [Rhodospirillum sp.]
MNVTGKLLGILAIAVVGLLFYLSIYVVGITVAPTFLTIMGFAGLALTALLFVIILAVTNAKTDG